MCHQNSDASHHQPQMAHTSLKTSFACAGSITLIGMPASGKSTLGRALARQLNKQFIDTDQRIESTYHKTLEQLIDEHGVARFLQIESDAVCSIDHENAVISTGGSAVYSERAMEHVATLGPIVYLEVSCDELEKRLGNLQQRGVVARDGSVVSLPQLYSERVPLYRRYANITVNVDGTTVQEALQKLLNALQ